MTKTVINTGTDAIVIFLFASATIDTLSVTDTVTGSFLLSGFLLEQALIATCFSFWIPLVLHLCMLLVLFVYQSSCSCSFRSYYNLCDSVCSYCSFRSFDTLTSGVIGSLAKRMRHGTFLTVRPLEVVPLFARMSVLTPTAVTSLRCENDSGDFDCKRSGPWELLMLDTILVSWNTWFRK